MEYAKAGADVVQAYTAFGYQGVGFARKVKDDLVDAFNVDNGEQTAAGSWAGVVKRSKDSWADGVKHVGNDLLKLGERIKQGESRIPWEDLVAERGLGLDVPGSNETKTGTKNGKDDFKAIPFGQTGPAAPSRDSPFAPAEEGGKGVVPAVAKQLTDFLGRARDVIGQDHVRSLGSGSVSGQTVSTPAATSRSPSSMSQTVDSGSSVQDGEPVDTRPASQRESAQLAWVNEVTRGDRRIV